MRRYVYISGVIACFLIFCEVSSQKALYPNEFPLRDVTLLDGQFKHALDLNIETFLEYDVDRLISGALCRKVIL